MYMIISAAWIYVAVRLLIKRKGRVKESKREREGEGGREENKKGRKGRWEGRREGEKEGKERKPTMLKDLRKFRGSLGRLEN